MRDFGFLMKWARYFSFAAVAMATLPAMSALAARPGHRHSYCPPQQQYCPQDEYAPAGQPHAAQSMDSNATDGSATTGDGQAQTQDQNQALAPQANNADLNLSAQNSDFQVAASGDGSNVGHIGRADNFNRLNIFDSQSAIPSNRIFYSNQYLDRFRITNDGAVADQTVSQVLYRMGGEIKVTDCSSITFQAQYVDVTGNNGIGPVNVANSWSNPQIMAKQIVYQDCDVTVSGTFGVLIPIGGVDLGEIREQTTRVAPGMLFYSNTTCDVFNYGGFQFSVPLASGRQVDTFDWAIGTGYWLYRNDCCCCGGLLERVSLQYEVFGKHSIGDTYQNYAGTDPLGIPFGFAVAENRNVFDMTAGISFFLCNGVRASVGYSIPVGRSFVRHNELIGTIGYYF